MPYCHNGVMEDHPRAAVGHDQANLLPHAWLVALDSAGVAGALVVVRALPGSLECVLDGFGAFPAKRTPVVAIRYMAVATAVDTCHGHQGALIFLKLAFAKLVCADFASHLSSFLAVDAL